MDRRSEVVVEHSGYRGKVFEIYENGQPAGALWSLTVPEDGTPGVHGCVEHVERQNPGDVPMMTVRLRRFIDNAIELGELPARPIVKGSAASPGERRRASR